MGTFTHFYKKAFCEQLVDPSNPLILSYGNVQRYPFIKYQWNHFGHSSYDQRSTRKVQLIFLEHFYFCLVVLLIMIVSHVSWRSRRSTWRRTRRLEDSKEQASSPLTMSMKPSLCVSYSSLLLLHRNHDEMVEHICWLPLLLPHWYLHCAWPYLLMRVMMVGVDRMLK